MVFLMLMFFLVAGTIAPQPPAGLQLARLTQADPLIPPEMRAAVRERLNPGCAYRFLSGGHFPYVARPADYIGLLEQVMDLNLTGTDWGTGDERAL